MDKARIFDGDFVVCVPYWVARSAIADGDIVVIERRRGEVVERSCKQVSASNSGVIFLPQSSDPAFKPVVLPDSNSPIDETGAVVEISGLVIGRYAPL